ncbi:hypothetical protein SDC9_171160 [bioreactor metagenome]|uniref:Uncharacterized protein n=1 Tax=bioreactor metagenome TaxID=1076179 RepID=A0A645GA33_9ZZZZ
MSEQNITTNELAGRLGKLEELILQMKMNEGRNDVANTKPESEKVDFKGQSGDACHPEDSSSQNKFESPYYDDDEDDDISCAPSSTTISDDEVISFGVGVGVGAALLGGGLLLAKLFSKD